MKSDAYGKIFLWPPLFVTYAPILFLLMAMLCCRIPLDRVSRWVTTNAFSDIFKEKKRKTCCPRETKWLFKDNDMTDDEELLSKVRTRFLMLFYVMFGLVLTIFWQLLVRDVSYDCDEDDLSKDCFERKWSLKSQDPLNCSSAAVQNLIRNGTIQVICNKIVFNFGLATGASYGSFKLSMFAVKVSTSAILLIKKTKILRWVQVSVVLLVLGTVISLIVVETVIPSVAIFFLNHLGAIAQMITTAIIAAVFLCFIPWRELIELKTQRENQQDTVLENPA